MLAGVRRREDPRLDHRFTVGAWQVDALSNTLSRDGETLHVEPKAVWVLSCLARHAGEIVTRQALYDEVWQGRPVTDEVLSRCVSVLRTALGDDPKNPAYIQTVPRVGYRLVAPVSGGEPDAPPPAAPEPGPPPPISAGPAGEAPARRHRGPVYALLLALVLASALALLVRDGDRQAGTEPVPASDPATTAIAVLPFANMSVDGADDYFSDGLTDELISTLSRVQGLRVIARTTSFAMRESREDVRTVGERLGVSRLVSGSVRVDGSKLRISVQLVDAVQGYELWSQVYDARKEDIFEVQRQISTAILAAVLPRLRPEGAGLPAAGEPPTRDSQAYDLYLRAIHILKRREEAPIRHAVLLLEEAIGLDPGYAAAYVELARAWALLPYYSRESQDEMFGRARSVLETARAQGAAVGDAAESLVAFMAFRSWDWLAAEESFRKALDYDANDPDLNQWYSQFLASVGHVEESLAYAQRAKELDALSPVVNDRLAVAYMWADQDALAARQFQEAGLLGLGPGANPGAHLVMLLRQRRHDDARKLIWLMQTRLEGSTRWIDPFIAALESPAARDEAVAALERALETGGIQPRYLFGAWIYLGEFDRAMSLAMTLVDDPVNFDVEFLFARESAGLRRHPRIGELFAAIGLDRYWERYGWPRQCRRMAGEIRCEA